MQDGFKVIKKKRKIKSKNLKVETIYETQHTFKRKLEKAIEEFESSQFCFEFLETINFCLTSLNVSSVNEILCYGLGSFTENKSSLHQLAALVRIYNNYNSNVILYDPAFTLFENKILEELNFRILPDNEEGKRKILKDQVTLVFLPHCPKQLINNFLWANWNTSLCRCILIANSFSKIIQENTIKVLNKTANYILKIHSRTKEISLEDYHIDNIFNDISVHYFSSQELDQNFFSETLEKEPVYLEDTEIITKTLENFVIKNE